MFFFFFFFLLAIYHAKTFILHVQSTLDKAKGWVKELQRQANSQIVIALVGNKLDLVEGNNNDQNENDTEEEQDDNNTSRQVTFEEASAYASEAGLLFFETSARTSTNVDEVFTEIGKFLDCCNKMFI